MVQLFVCSHDSRAGDVPLSGTMLQSGRVPARFGFSPQVGWRLRMKVFPVLFPLIAIGTSVATPCCAQYHPAPTQAVAKRPHFSPPAVPGSRHGSIGGPAGKSGGI